MRGRRGTWARTLGATLLVAVSTATPAWAQAGDPAQAPSCRPGGPRIELTGDAEPADAKTYRELPFQVEPGTTRVEVGYRWENRSPDPPSSSLNNSVVDLGLWDQHGYRSAEGFRGWSGSRQGRVAEGMAPVWVQADTAERGYLPGPVEPGTWWVDLGIAAVHSSGLRYTVEIRCLDTPVGPPFVATRVDPAHVVDPQPGWYHGDLHMHGVHSSPAAPPWTDGPSDQPTSFMEYARSAGLQFTPVTDYVTTQHWRELGAVQAANPDLLIWPGREVITYFGHVIVLGETASPEYRHGFEDVTLNQILVDADRDGALVSVAHPTTFEPPLDNLCRGCAFSLDDDIDWSLVDTIEVLNSPKHLADAVPELAASAPPDAVQPFLATALAYWEDLLRRGYKITAVSGSDDKEGPDLGTSATNVYARELSRRGLTDALEAGHAYIQLDGADGSPVVTVEAKAPDGTTGMMGDSFAAEAVEVTVTVEKADGQVLRVTRDGTEVEEVPVAGDRFTHTFTAAKADGAGPLGTFWRVDTLTPSNDAPTTITNPVFVGAPATSLGASTTTPATTPPGTTAAGTGAADASADDSTPGTVFLGVGIGVVVVIVIAIGVVAITRRRAG